MEHLEQLEHLALEQVAQAQSLQDIVNVRSLLLGKKGLLGTALRSLGSLPPTERPMVGEKINAIKQRIEAVLTAAQQRIARRQTEERLQRGRYDVTLPGRRTVVGASHPLRLVEAQVIECLRDLGFLVAEGPIIEYDWYNFEALNMPAGHPARDMQDTFFINPQVVLRTHTSNVQIRTMVTHQPPVRIIAPGMVFRKDAVDATHSPVFHQIEGLWIDDRATFANLKGVLRKLVRALFGARADVRFRPSYFPFTEPSVEIDVRTTDRWLEILGAGMVNPAVLRAVKYNPDEVQGFAFGVGLERIAMLKYGIDDIRLFYENDLRFLRQFRNVA